MNSNKITLKENHCLKQKKNDFLAHLFIFLGSLCV